MIVGTYKTTESKSIYVLAFTKHSADFFVYQNVPQGKITMKTVKITMPPYSLFLIITAFLIVPTLHAQEGYRTSVDLQGATRIVADINGGIGTLYLKRESGNTLMTLREKRKEDEQRSDVTVDYDIRDGVGYLTMDLGNQDGDDMNALACLFRGKDSRTWYVSISDRVPIDFDISLGAGKASLDLTGIHVRGLVIDAGAGSVRARVDRPNRQSIGKVKFSAGVGSVKTRSLGNLRFSALDFDGGIGEYELDCSGALPDGARINTDIGVGTLKIALPKGVAARAVIGDNPLNSTKMYRFVRQNGNVYTTTDYESNSRRVYLNIEAGLGSVSVHWK